MILSFLSVSFFGSITVVKNDGCVSSSSFVRSRIYLPSPLLTVTSLPAALRLCCWRALASPLQETNIRFVRLCLPLWIIAIDHNNHERRAWEYAIRTPCWTSTWRHAATEQCYYYSCARVVCVFFFGVCELLLLNQLMPTFHLHPPGRSGTNSI